MIFAPGNFVRRAVSDYPHESLVDTILTNLSSISYLTLHPEGRLALVAWGAAGLVYTLMVVMGGAKKIFPALGAVLGGLLLVFLAWQESALFLPVLLLLYSLMLALGVWWRCVPLWAAAAFLSAVASLVLLLLAPVVAPRALLTFYCLMLVPLTYAGVVAYRFRPSLWVVIVLAFAVPAVDKARVVYDGYAQNAATHQLNDAKMLATGMEAQMGRVPEQIVLYRLPDDRFAETMAYQRPLIETWMRRYYQVPEVVSIEWRAPLEQKP